MILKDDIFSIMFNYENLNEEEIKNKCSNMPRKILRWLGAFHPDNKTRKIFFKMTNVLIGDDTIICQNFIVSDGYAQLLTIGNRVAISPNVSVICEAGPNFSLLQFHPYVIENLVCKKEVVIEDDVWIGYNVVILPGVTIGAKSIIGAGSVVVKDVPPMSIVAGVPARLIRSLE